MPKVFAHRGSSALRPEHTAASYARAIADGADYIEPDLVMTKDSVLVARHENNIAGTTDVAARAEFADRRATKTIDGREETGWFTEDFSLAELKTLRAIEPMGDTRPESKAYDGQFQVMTFAEIIEFAAAESEAKGRPIGIAPELKHSTYFAGIGLPMEDSFIDTVTANSYAQTCPLVVQSFEVANLRYLHGKLGERENIELMQLIGGPNERPADIVKASGSTTYGQMIARDGLNEMAGYADIVAPHKLMIIPHAEDGSLAEPTSLVADAHEAGLKVGTWTFRPENRFLPLALQDGNGPDSRHESGSVEEIRAYLRAGIDGFFTDDPAIGRQAVDGFL